MKRYAAKLLFQFRVDIGRESGKRRICEERIITFESNSPKRAIARAKRKGKSGEHSYKNSDGNWVFFEFVGVMELLELGVECERDDVWYEIVERVLPMERRTKFIPRESELNAMKHHSSNTKRP